MVRLRVRRRNRFRGIQRIRAALGRGLGARGSNAPAPDAAERARLVDGYFIARRLPRLFCVDASWRRDLGAALGNIFWFLGVALYWRSIRRFFAVRDNPLVFFAAGAGVMGSVFFLIVLPHFSTRIALVTLFGSLPLLGAAYTLWRHRGEPASPCGWVLIALFIGSIALLIVRTGFFLAGAARADAMVESKSFALSLAPVLLVSLPIVGTTAFVLLCLERVHRGLADPRVAGASRKR